MAQQKTRYGTVHLQRCVVRPYPYLGRRFGAKWPACGQHPAGAGAAPVCTTAHVRLVTCKTCLRVARRA